jgi:integrase/recombinase XerD
VFIRDGKCGKDGIALLSNDCIDTLRDYLDLRPPLILDNGESPLFYTDWGNRFTRWKIYLFSKYKAKAGVKTHGEVHVFGRHTPATLMIENGADISIAQRLLRHNDIRTTLQYVHLSDKFCREKYDECLKI